MTPHWSVWWSLVVIFPMAAGWSVCWLGIWVVFFLQTIFMGRMIFLHPANIRWLATCCVTALVVI